MRTRRRPQRWLVITLALLLDLTAGDPPNRWHPVAWMGSLIAWLRRRAPAAGPRAQFIYGGGLAVGGVALWAAVGGLLEAAARRLPGWLSVPVQALLLKMTLSLNGLLRAGRAVQEPLQAGELTEARRQLSWHLVSRDTSALDEAQVAAATVESLAENTSDGVVAPLFWYAVGGLPAALSYRFLNTADAMLGYRDAAREWLGKAGARLDDGANLLPARLTAALIVLAAPVAGGRVSDAWRIWRRDAGQTASPNAGHPMAAAAGALGVELDKVGHYRLGAGGRRAEGSDIARMIVLARWVALAGALAAGLLALGVERARVGRASRREKNEE